jgi:hypothetical protein
MIVRIFIITVAKCKQGNTSTSIQKKYYQKILPIKKKKQKQILLMKSANEIS